MHINLLITFLFNIYRASFSIAQTNELFKCLGIESTALCASFLSFRSEWIEKWIESRQFGGLRCFTIPMKCLFSILSRFFIDFFSSVDTEFAIHFFAVLIKFTFEIKRYGFTLWISIQFLNEKKSSDTDWMKNRLNESVGHFTQPC